MLDLLDGDRALFAPVRRFPAPGVAQDEQLGGHPPVEQPWPRGRAALGVRRLARDATSVDGRVQLHGHAAGGLGLLGQAGAALPAGQRAHGNASGGLE